jgi:hypothetical protein
MKVVTNKKDTVSIRDIGIGGTFIDDDEVFMICRYEGDDIYCPRCDEEISIGDQVGYLAVSLVSGDIYNFASNVYVTPVDCEAKII